MCSHPGSGLKKGVGVPLSPRATWAWVAISYLLHPLAPSRELPSLTATCHHLYTGTPKVTKTDCCLQTRTSLPTRLCRNLQEGLENFTLGWPWVGVTA